MRLYLAILLTAVSVLGACDRVDALFADNPDDAPAPAEGRESLDFVVDGDGVFYATHGADGKLHNATKVAQIPIAERATTFVYVEGQTPSLRGEEARYVVNLVEAQAGDRRTAVLRQPDFVKASELAGLGGARAALDVQRRSAGLTDSDDRGSALDSPRQRRPRKRGRSDSTGAAKAEPKGIIIESVGGEGATNAPGFDNSKSGGWKPVTVYYADWCGVCTRAMRWMDKNDVSYRAVDIEASDRNRREMIDFCREKNRSPNSVPTIRIGDDIMKGWSASRFQKMAKL
ncbi:MAG: glutaredoxin family protein [Myxococcota bacterium]